LPKQVTLRQYYHLRRGDVNAILEHWAQRQAAGKVPFRFRSVAKTIQQNKRATKENDSNADMGLGKEAKEDLQDDDSSQSRGHGVLQGDGDSTGSTGQAHLHQSLRNAAKNPSGVIWLLKH